MRFTGHLRTVLKHKYMVFIHCVKAGIPVQGFLHDMSKFSPTEFFPSVKYFTGHRSPTELERENNGFSKAWMHHKGRNLHHYEYWTDYDFRTKQLMSVKMPIKYVKEMFCDRLAASKVYLGKKYTDSHPLSYFLGGSARKNMNQQTSQLLESWLLQLQNEGEAAVFKTLRKTKDY